MTVKAGETARSILRLRPQGHLHPERPNEAVVEVVRDGQVVASIYGSREGIHGVTQRQPYNRVFAIEGQSFHLPGWSLTLLAEGEVCPWCAGRGEIGPGQVCPVCSPLEVTP